MLPSTDHQILPSKVTDSKAIHQYVEYGQLLSSKVNMPCTNTTLDVGAAINTFKYLWSNNNTFSNVVLRLGDFHFMKENFKVKIFQVCFRG